MLFDIEIQRRYFMFEVWQRVHEATHPMYPTVSYETVSVHDSNSKTTRIIPNSILTDAKVIQNTQSASVKARAGFNGATLKIACLLRDGWNVTVIKFDLMGSYSSREEAEQARDNYLNSAFGSSHNIILGRPGFRFNSGNGKSKKSTFYQPISGDKVTAINRITTLVQNYAMNFNTSILTGQKMNNGFRVDSIGMIYHYCADRPKHIPSNFAVINGVRFEEGEFKNYGEIFKKLLDASIIY